MRISQCIPGALAGFASVTHYTSPWGAYDDRGDKLLVPSTVEIVSVEPIQQHPRIQTIARPPMPVLIKHPDHPEPVYVPTGGLTSTARFEKQSKFIERAQESARQAARILNEAAPDLLIALPKAEIAPTYFLDKRPQNKVSVLLERQAIEHMGVVVPDTIALTKLTYSEFRAFVGQVIRRIGITYKSGADAPYNAAQVPHVRDVLCERFSRELLDEEYPLYIDVQMQHVGKLLTALGRKPTIAPHNDNVPDGVSSEILGLLEDAAG